MSGKITLQAQVKHFARGLLQAGHHPQEIVEVLLYEIEALRLAMEMESDLPGRTIKKGSH
jgi:hypothetical protein